MQFRSKSPDRAVREVADLMAAHRVHIIDAVDNIIDMAYLETFCRDLASAGWDIDMFFEIKANLTPAQLATLRQAGITRIQPGIESLSSNVLRLMRKGSTMLMNIRLLKWARYYGMDTGWNILMGFPGETDEDYEHQAALIPSLTHLQPPGGCGPLWLERFSPYFSDESFPITGLTARSAYRLVYPVAGLDHEKIAYFFDGQIGDTASERAHDLVRSAVDRWRAAWADGPPVLAYRRGPGWIQILDSRAGRWRKAVLSGWQAVAYEAIGANARGVPQVAAVVADGGDAVTDDDVADFLARMVGHGLAAEEGGRYLALAVPTRADHERSSAGPTGAGAAWMSPSEPGRLLPLASTH
jgi:ribosomal peptide maturation radical SAM protein 1